MNITSRQQKTKELISLCVSAADLCHCFWHRLIYDSYYLNMSFEGQCQSDLALEGAILTRKAPKMQTTKLHLQNFEKLSISKNQRLDSKNCQYRKIKD